MEKDNWITLKNSIKDYASIAQFTWLSSKIVGIIPLAFLSLLIYMMGYLFLWGYYFGGSEDFSLLSMAINYIPLNRTVAILIGLFYFLTIIVICLLLISIFKEGFSINKLIFMIITVVTTNLAFIIFFHGESNLQLFIKMLRLWLYPFIIVVILAYHHTWMRYPTSSKKFFVFVCFFMLNTILINKVFLSNKLDAYLEPELYLILMYIFLPVLILLKKIKNKFLKGISKVLLYFTGTVPLFPLIMGLLTKSLILNILISILLVSVVVIISENNLHEKWLRIFSKTGKSENSNKEQQKVEKAPLLTEKPFVTGMYFASILLILLVLIPNMLIKGGDYFHTMVNVEEYKEISYVWNDKIKTVKGVLVSSKDNTFYISTEEQKLLVVKAEYILTDGR